MNLIKNKWKNSIHHRFVICVLLLISTLTLIVMNLIHPRPYLSYTIPLPVILLIFISSEMNAYKFATHKEISSAIKANAFTDFEIIPKRKLYKFTINLITFFMMVIALISLAKEGIASKTNDIPLAHIFVSSSIFSLLVLLLIHTNRMNLDKKIAKLPKDKSLAKLKRIPTSLFTYLLFANVYLLVLATNAPMLMSNHSPKAYETEIESLKEQRNDKYAAFPDEIPEGATDIKWIVKPAYYKSPRYSYLIFKTTPEYIESVISKYSKDVLYTCTYKEADDFWLDKGKFSLKSVCCSSENMNDENATCYILTSYPVNDKDHQTGFCINTSTNTICFFEQISSATILTAK